MVSLCGTGALGAQGSVAAAQELRGCGSQALELAQWLQHTGLVVPQHEGSSLSRDQTHLSCIGRWIFFFTTESTGEPGKILLNSEIQL